MGRLIRVNAAAVSIIGDARVTLIHARVHGGLFQRGAERFLGELVGRARVLGREIEDSGERVDRAKAEVARLSRCCNEGVAEIRDLAFNKIGRRLRDPVFKLIFPHGIGACTRVPVSAKAAALREVADAFEIAQHPRIAETLVERFTADLRAHADRLGAAVKRCAEAQEAHEVLRAEYQDFARRLHTQLSRLKKHWSSEGLTEQEIHLAIPHRPRTKRSRRAEEGTSEAEAAGNPASGEPDPVREQQDQARGPQEQAGGSQASQEHAGAPPQQKKDAPPGDDGEGAVVDGVPRRGPGPAS